MTSLATVLPLRRSAAPSTEPPFDDELELLGRRSAVPMLGSLALPLEGMAGTVVVRTGRDRPARRRDHLRVVPDLAAGAPHAPTSPGPRTRTRTPGAQPRAGAERARVSPHRDDAGLPDATVWCQRFVPALVEVLGGERPLSQVSAYVTPKVAEGLRGRVSALARAGAPGRAGHRRAVVRSLRITEPADGVVEACATVRRGERTVALALRLEAREGRWRATVVQPGWTTA